MAKMRFDVTGEWCAAYPELALGLIKRLQDELDVSEAALKAANEEIDDMHMDAAGEDQ